MRVLYERGSSNRPKSGRMLERRPYAKNSQGGILSESQRVCPYMDLGETKVGPIQQGIKTKISSVPSGVIV